MKKGGNDLAKATRRYFRIVGRPQIQPDPKKPDPIKDRPLTKRELRILRDYLEETLHDDLPSVSTWHTLHKNKNLTPQLERYMRAVDYFLTDDLPLRPKEPERVSKLLKIPTDILFYAEVVRQSFDGRITREELLEELEIAFRGVSRATSAKAIKDPGNPQKIIWEEVLGVKIDLETITNTVKKDFAYSLVHDYLVDAGNFNANCYAIQNGFSSSREMLNSLDDKHKVKYRNSILKIYEARTAAGEKVNVSEMCRLAGISTSTFYAFVREKHGSMEQYRNNIIFGKEKKPRITIEDTPTYKFQEKYSRTRYDPLRRTAAAAAFAASLIAPSPSKNTQDFYDQEPPAVVTSAPIDSKNYTTLAEADAFLKPLTPKESD